MYKRDTIWVTIPNATADECILHFVNRPTIVEVQLYKGGNPNKKVTLGYWHKSSTYFEPVGMSHEWPIFKMVADVILKQNAGLNQASFNDLKIEYFGEQRVLRNLYASV